MAFFKRVIPDEREIRSLHPTEVECSYMVAERDGKLILQLDSYGSDHRQIPDKLRQTLQFDEKSAQELWEGLGRTFKFR